MVALFVAGDLFAPEFGVLLGLDVAAWTSVPETAIHKHGQSLLWKNEIGLAGQRLMPSPALDAMFSKKFE